jgi:tRNA A-37 threonylcarbamoyl transferase component Bud32/TolB-like protein/tetratricopeptide (TPR) repeat protein
MTTGSDQPPTSFRWLRRLMARLRHQQPGFDFLERPAGGLATPLLRTWETAPVDALPGEELGPYRLVSEVGRGAHAAVYLAFDPRHERQVALKVLHPIVAASLGRRRFLQEIKLAARLQHPHILPVFDSGDSAGRLWYAMPYVAGESLRHRLRREPRLPISEAVQITREVALALDYAHRQGIIHRDIKPANILLADGQALVADFGIARALNRRQGKDEDRNESLTETGLVIGTPAYMSPEQALGDTSVDGRSDLYSLGCVLFEALVGQPPFNGPSTAAVIHQHLAVDPPSPSELRPQVPTRIIGVLTRALAKLPENRFQTGAQFAEALGAGESEPATAVLPALPTRATVRARAGPAVAVGLAGAAALVYLADFRSPSSEVEVNPVASTLVVLPLVSVSSDTALARLGRELVVTLSANLNGIGGIRTVEPLTVLAQVKEGEVLSSQQGAELGRRLGSRGMLQGTLVREGRGVRLDLALLGTNDLRPVAQFTIAGPAEDLAALTDSTTIAIVKEVVREGTVPVPSLAAMTTHSVVALRAYLEGEQALARSEFDKAVPAFERAYAADSSFWFAYWRSLYPRMYEGTPPDSTTLAGLYQHRDRLPEPDRLLLESQQATTTSERLSALRNITSRFPTYWPGWYDYANYLVHWTPYIGTQLSDARAALERTVQLDPQFMPAWEHLLWIGTMQRDSVATGRALHQLENVSSAFAFRLNAELLYYYRLLHRLTVSNGVFNPADLDSVTHYVSTYRGSIPPRAFGLGLLEYGFSRATVQLAQAVLQLGPRRELAASMWLGAGLGYAGRGAWDSALVAMNRWVRLDEDATAPLVTYGLAVTGGALGGLEPKVVAAARPRLPSGAASLMPEEAAELAWLDGVLAFTSRDPKALKGARDRLQASGSAYVELLDSSLASFQLALTGQTERAARALAGLEWKSAERLLHDAYAQYHPYFNAVNRLSAVPWLLASGDTAQAARLLRWHDGDFWYLQHRFLLAVNKTVEPVALFEQAQIEAALGQTATAAALDREFIRRYDQARGAWGAHVEEAIGALERR